MGCGGDELGGPNRMVLAQVPVLAFSFPIFPLILNLNLNFNLNSNFVAHHLQTIFVKLEVLILEIFIYIYYLYFHILSLFHYSTF